jgi:hypothetical protein
MYMFRTGESFDYVVDSLVNDKMLFKKGGALGVRNGQGFNSGRRSSFSAPRRGNFGEETYSKGRRPTTPMRTTKELRRKMFNQMDTSPSRGGRRDLSPRLAISNASYAKNDLLLENEYQSAKLDIVANLRAVFKKPLNPDGSQTDPLHQKTGIRHIGNTNK